MRNHTVFLSVVFLLIALTACSSNQVQTGSPQDHPKALQENLADRNLEVGQQVERIPNFSVKGWKYVDDKNLTVMGGDSKTYLVTLQNKCYGLGLSASSLLIKSAGDVQLGRHDTFLVKNKGMTINHCKVETMHELNPIP
jgi:hypothetical protein